MTATVLKMTNEKVVNTHIFSKDSINILKQKMSTIHVRSGDYLYYEGDSIDKIYYILVGSINLYKSTEDGKILTLNYFEADDMFGDCTSNSKRGSMENAKAIEDSVVGVIDKHDIEILLWENRNFSMEFTKWVSFSQQLTQTKLRDLMFFGKNGALASVLIRMTNTYGIQEGDMWRITKKFTHDEISSFIGTPRETVTRMLNQLKKDGIIQYEKGYLTVYNLNSLRQICRCDDCPLQVCRL
ncbi:Crp/Fnr family transcriptional regulator [Metabacillus sp. FJAT-53654]|jgi:CRP/FNR family transcriptional regulator, cyclic AMP receptor protein|uniref:Crp/Fnr family transcriptional regulator n=1 Tax=Metabacillus rhizosphaerae TaxID=3117747 RepID=A0ABZ2MXN9_9BACI